MQPTKTSIPVLNYKQQTLIIFMFNLQANYQCNIIDWKTSSTDWIGSSSFKIVLWQLLEEAFYMQSIFVGGLMYNF